MTRHSLDDPRKRFRTPEDMGDEGVMDGSWNGTTKESRAHDPLGDLKREGACWVNETARVCAK